MYSFDWNVMSTAVKYIGGGLVTTLGISVSALVFGVIVGLPVGIMRSAEHANSFVKSVLSTYVEVFRNIPVLVLIVWIYYVLPILVGLNLSPIVAGTLALALNTGAFLSEVFRGGIKGIPVGQQEASVSLGLTRSLTLRYVTLPQVLRKMLAPLLNQFIVLIKESALVAYIGVLDVMHRGDMISTEYSRPLEAFTVVAGFYLVICFCVSRLTRWIEVRVAIPE
ncbi:amino acid ABC transporter permease [Paraburkholderia sp.]|uniref:amino acid ABC transporter permease n=1 Tax=Paraburkholderia sp. TaxID=1926495 RepID=UPI0039E41754